MGEPTDVFNTTFVFYDQQWRRRKYEILHVEFCTTSLDEVRAHNHQRGGKKNISHLKLPTMNPTLHNLVHGGHFRNKVFRITHTVNRAYKMSNIWFAISQQRTHFLWL